MNQQVEYVYEVWMDLVHESGRIHSFSIGEIHSTIADAKNSAVCWGNAYYVVEKKTRVKRRIIK